MRTKFGAREFPRHLTSQPRIQLTSTRIARKSAPVQTGIIKKYRPSPRTSRFAHSRGILHTLSTKQRKALRAVNIEMVFEIKISEKTRENVLKFKRLCLDTTVLSRKIGVTRRKVEDFEYIDKILNQMIELYFDFMLESVVRTSFADYLKEEIEIIIERQFEINAENPKNDLRVRIGDETI